MEDRSPHDRWMSQDPTRIELGEVKRTTVLFEMENGSQHTLAFGPAVAAIDTDMHRHAEGLDVAAPGPLFPARMFADPEVVLRLEHIKEVVPRWTAFAGTFMSYEYTAPAEEQ